MSVRVGKSQYSGKGLYAKRNFANGDRVCEYTGSLYPNGMEPENRYIFEVDDDWTLDGSDMSNLGRWANHSHRPNCDIDITPHRRIWIYARRRIRAGEEITYDYGDWYGWITKRNCRCDKCRERRRAYGKVNGNGKGRKR